MTTELSSNATTAATTESLPQRGKAAQLDSLTGLRFVAALLVFGFHSQVVHLADTGPAGAVLRFLFIQGSSGVTFFFILSGFVLAWSARPGDTAIRFWRRRVAKIWPNHLVTLLGAVVVGTAAGTALTAAILIPNLLLVQAWSPSETIYFGLNTVSWSLACEVFFYSLFPLLYRYLGAIPARWLWPAAGGAFGLVWAVPLLVHIVNGGHNYWATWVFPVSRAPEFIAGMMLALVVRDRHWPRWLGVWPTGILAAIVYLASWWAPENIKHVALVAVPFGLFIAAVAAADAFGPGTRFDTPSAVLLGEMSFAFYLVHQLVLRGVTYYVGVDNPEYFEVGVTIGTLVLAVLASWALYVLIEKPGMRLLKPSGRHLA